MKDDKLMNLRVGFLGRFFLITFFCLIKCDLVILFCGTFLSGPS